MKFESVVLSHVTGLEPPLVCTSAEIESRLGPLYQRLKLPAGRLELMTGIRERRFWPGRMLPSEAAAQAGERLLAESSAEKRGIDLLIHCGVCRDRLEPATAAYVHQRLGCPPQTQILDVSNACLGVLSALTLAAGLIESGQIVRALLVSGEDGRPLLENTIRLLLQGDWDRQTIKPFFANLTIGAGAVALLVEHEKVAEPGAGLRLLHAVNETDSSHNRLCEGAAAGEDGLEMWTEAEALLEAGLSVAQRCWERFLRETGWRVEAIARVFCHQVGRAHQRRLLATLGLPREKDFSTYETLGNTGSVALPITLARALQEKVLQKGDGVALLGIGSGLSSLMMALEKR